MAVRAEQASAGCPRATGGPQLCKGWTRGLPRGQIAAASGPRGLGQRTWAALPASPGHGGGPVLCSRLQTLPHHKPQHTCASLRAELSGPLWNRLPLHTQPTQRFPTIVLMVIMHHSF